MHFSKTYTQLILSLPPELRNNAIQYRQLKKLINQIVRELSSLGLSPALLQELLERSKNESDALGAIGDGSDKGKGKERADDTDEIFSAFGQRHNLAKVVYEVTDDSGRIEPHLRLWVDRPPSHLPSAGASGSSGSVSSSSPRSSDPADSSEPITDSEQDGAVGERPVSKGQISLLWALQRQVHLAGTEDAKDDRSSRIVELNESSENLPNLPNPELEPTTTDQHQPSSNSAGANINVPAGPSQVVIPLESDMRFFQMLSTAMNDLSTHLATVQSDFADTLDTLSRTIAASARPVSAKSSTFRPHSILTSQPWNVSNATKTNSDLYSWREVFQLYIEAEVFESVHEMDRGERSIEESEQRLKLFAERVAERGLGDSRTMKSKASRNALETFLELNVFILNIKKFQFANAEATRKILKKHAKRTSLRFPDGSESNLPNAASSQSLIVLPPSMATTTKTITLPRILVQAIGETLLPIIPHLDDYTCSICTSIAFKPIRLGCGHLFCVRCLVKMQKRGQGDCPMCRAPCVLVADRSNVDWALLNFMQDWFPVEAKEKAKQNEAEAVREELEELGVNPDQQCRIM